MRRRRGGRDRTGVYHRIRGPARIGCRIGAKDRLPRPAPDVAAHRWYRRSVPIPRRYTTDAIVLSRFDCGEADRVLTLITPTVGKLKAIAKGIRRPDLAARRQPRAVRRADRGARPRPDVRRRHPGQRRARLARPARLARERRHGVVPRRAGGPLARGAPRRRAALRAAASARYELLDAGMAPGRVARWYEMHLADELGVRPEVDRCVECDRVLEADERFRWVPAARRGRLRALPGPAARPDAAQPRGAEAAQGLPAPGYRGAGGAPPVAGGRARGRDRAARVRPPRPRAGGALAAPSSTRSATRRCPADGPGRAARHRHRRGPRRGDRPRGGARAGPLRRVRRGVVPRRDRRRAGGAPDVVGPRRGRDDGGVRDDQRRDRAHGGRPHRPVLPVAAAHRPPLPAARLRHRGPRRDRGLRADASRRRHPVGRARARARARPSRSTSATGSWRRTASSRTRSSCDSTCSRRRHEGTRSDHPRRRPDRWSASRRT